MTLPQALQIAMLHHQAGRLAEADGLYRQILAVQPNHADALHLLGVIAHQAGRHEVAVDLIRQAIVLNPNDPAAHANLGEAYRATGRFDEAIAMFRRAIQFKPDYQEAYNNLGNVLRQRGQLDEAIAACRRALEINPDFSEAHNNLAAALAEQGRSDEAGAAYRRALELRPDFPEAHNNLGAALAGQGRFDEAMAAYRHALELKPEYPNAHVNVGNALRDRGLLDEAVAAYRRALELDPAFPEAHNNLGNALRDRGQPDEAIAEYRGAIQLRPDYLEAHNNMGDTLKSQGELDEAIAAFRQALRVRPECSWAHSNLILALYFHPDHDERTISEEHQRWNRQFSEPVKRDARPYANDPAVARRLRVGYVSADFRDHPVGRHALPLFERHDRERFDILCYSGVARPDWMTERLRALAGPARNASRSDAGGGWRNTAGVSDAGLAEMIREDGVDILVDLAMHTAGNRLPVFARQPAPVQVSWLAYPGSTGLPGIGYRLTDALMEPPGTKPTWSAEEPVRLPDCWCCYDPAGESPEINALPALSAESVTFGSLNNFAKVNEGVLALWVRVLEAVRGSRLLMLCPEGQTRERVRAFFNARGVMEERVEFVGFLPRWEYLKLDQRIDIGLDPFPFNGMTTTCDALWMGVPVVTLPGKMPVSRAGLSLLSSVGLGELAASSEEDYVRIVGELAGNLPRLADLRATLRPRMLGSPLMDAPRFARNVEAVYRSMWQAWSGKLSFKRE